MVDAGSIGSEDHAAVVDAVRSSIQDPLRVSLRGDVEIMAAAQLPATTKLAMLAHLKDAGVERPALVHLASSLVRQDLEDNVRNGVAEQLVDRVVHAAGRDPLGRNGLDADPETVALMGNLIPTVATSALSVLPACKAERVDIGGQPVLCVRTELWSSTPLHRYKPVIDPTQWPLCPVQSHFFKDMQLIGSKSPLPAPDDSADGWSATLLETVDFGFGTGEMNTKLNFVFHANESSIGCTYTLAPNGSEGGEILHDEGYLLAQDLGKSRNARRVTTLKAVWFKNKNTPVDKVCPIWSVAAGLVAHACLQER